MNLYFAHLYSLNRISIQLLKYQIFRFLTYLGLFDFIPRHCILFIQFSFLLMVLRIKNFLSSTRKIQQNPKRIQINLWPIILWVVLTIIHNKRTHIPNSPTVVPSVLMIPKVLNEPKINQFYHIGRIFIV